MSNFCLINDNFGNTFTYSESTLNIQSFYYCFSGAGLHAGVYGTLLAGYECPKGKYPVTIALLQFLGNMVEVNIHHSVNIPPNLYKISVG